ncbi:uncharacterized protein TRAVEDRAFT_28813 [Trametes versicolor FP-101664 SS1]|uniref:uncharacterized protein n=1 Tax=Trametes versicolor (strain FP-101664) TaxID=717944 RepID=UPI00046217F3|nr:uncharacterized protein TRAVEDRAFT_28813 [Trametes versicolor FP-101664 SS1]EIW59812.1 hypothetical protein TRAVEDRAFT_28813 [Trametes versicolor FP-101664 SS1]
MYTSNTSYRPPARESLPFTKVDVAASEAVVPDALARALRDPLEPAFPDIIGLSSREGKKFTFRLVFVGSNRQPHGPLRNERPKQRHERASMKTQAELAASVKAAERLSGRKPLRKNSKSVPLMRIALVEMVALELQSVMKELKGKNRPLTFRGREVDFAHVKIMNIYRPTSATMQPTLEILHEYRSLYMADNAPVHAVVDQAHDDQAREDQSVIWGPAWDHPTAPTTPATGHTDVPTTPGIGRADEPCTFTPVLGGYLQYDEPFTLTPAHGSYPQCDQPFTFAPAHGGYLQCDEPGMSNIDYMQGQMPPVANGPWAMGNAANTIPTPGGPPTRYAPPPPPPFMWRPEMVHPGSADAEATLGLGFADVQGGVRTPANGNLNLEANTRTPATDDDVYFDLERYGESTMPNLWATQTGAGRRSAMRMWPNRGPRPAAAASTSACRYF